MNAFVTSLIPWQTPVVPVEPAQQPDHARDVYLAPTAVKVTEQGVTTPFSFRGWQVDVAPVSTMVGGGVGVGVGVGVALGVGVGAGFTVTVASSGVAVSAFRASYTVFPVAAG